MLLPESDDEINIKPLGPEQAQQVSDLHLYIWQQAYAPIFGKERLRDLPREESRQTWRQRMHLERYRGIGLWQQERLIGFAGWGVEATAIAEIYHFYLHPEYWGGGTAGSFMQYLLQLIRQQNHQEVVLWVLKENKRAQRFYQKQGFEPAHLEKQRNKWGLVIEEVQFKRQLI